MPQMSLLTPGNLNVSQVIMPPFHHTTHVQPLSHAARAIEPHSQESSEKKERLLQVDVRQVAKAALTAHNRQKLASNAISWTESKYMQHVFLEHVHGEALCPYNQKVFVSCMMQERITPERAPPSCFSFTVHLRRPKNRRHAQECAERSSGILREATKSLVCDEPCGAGSSGSTHP